MAEERRREKVNLLVQEELAKILSREVEFPKGVFVTVTRIVSSPDLYYADAFVSVYPKKEKEVMKILEKGTPFLQSRLNKQLKMRPVPRLFFKVDEEEKNRERLERILNYIKEKE